MLNRINSGIPGLDSIIQQGIPSNDLILLSGTCGAGKTTFGLQFLCSHARTEPGIYVSFEETIPQIKGIAKSTSC